MKAVQIKSYSGNIKTVLNHIPKPQISDSEVLIRVKAAAVNPVDLLILTGSVKLIQDYPMPLALGNECSGIVEKQQIKPAIDPHVFSLDQADEALRLVSGGQLNGKVIIQL